ncbi:MAG: PAS domain S-box protein [Bacteroidota bacterium]
MVYFLRILLISFTVVIIVVLLIVFRTFSALRSQEREQQKISQSREALQKTGPAIITMQEFESLASDYPEKNDPELSDRYAMLVKKLKADSINMISLAKANPANQSTYKELAEIIHKILTAGDSGIHTGSTSSSALAIAGHRLFLVNKFREMATRLEEGNRQALMVSYNHSIGLTRDTFSFVRVISGLLLFILIISFYFIYHDSKTRKRAEEQLTRFNTALEKQVAEKTATISKSEDRYRSLVEKLELSEKDLRSVLSSAADNFYVVDTNYRVRLINEAAEKNLKKAWGTPVIAGTNILDLLPDEKGEPVRASMKKVFAGNKVEYELYHSQEDLPPWVLVSYTPVTDESGKITGAYILTKDITERKKAELELVEAEAKFRNLVEQSLIGVYIISGGKFAYVNPRFAEIFGYRQDELINLMPLEGVIHPDDRERVTENVRARVKGEKDSIHYEANGLKKDGDITQVEVFCRGTLYEGSNAIIGTILDISERKRAEEVIRNNEEQLKLIYNTTSDAIFLVSVDGDQYRFNSVNHAFLSATGLSEEQVKGKHVNEVIPAPSLPLVLDNYSKAIHSRQSVQWEETSDYPLGSRSGIVTITPVFNDKDECNMLVGAVHDITERKKAEEAVKKSEERYRTLVENAPEALVVFDMDKQKFVSVSESAVRLFKMSREELLKRGPVDMSPQYQPDGRLSSAIAMEKINRAIGGEKPSFEWTHQDIEGNLIPCEIWLVRLPAENQVLIRGSIVDISERKKAEQEKEHVRHLLNERVKELTTLYQVSQVFQSEKRSVLEILQEVVSILPSGWQHQDITAARILFGDMEFKTPNFGTAFHKQTSAFPIPDGKKGEIEIIYLQPRPPESEDAFLAEERNLINMVGEMLRIYLARQHGAEVNKKMEQEMLRQKIQEQKIITRAVLNAEEKERNKIGRELHDNVNQILASTKLFIKMAEEKDVTGGNELLNRSAKLVDAAIQEIRSLSQSQVTPLKMIDLEELIQTLVDRLDDSTSVKTTFTYEKDRDVDDELKLNIYRIVQEQINNILKYAEATAITIRVNADNGFFHVLIADNGKGFDPETKRKGIGISNMINRVESFNGELNIISSPGNGCKIEIKIPC